MRNLVFVGIRAILSDMEKKTRKTVFWKIAVRVVLYSLAFFVILPGCVADKAIFQPPKSRFNDQKLLRLEVEPGVWVSLLYLPPPVADAPVLLYSHGNAEDLSWLGPYLAEYTERGYGIVAYDYEGYGQSSGKPSEKNCYRDIDRVYRFLIEEAKILPEKIIIYGVSVGSGPSCYLAEKSRAAALVLEAPLTSAFAVVNMGWMPFDRFPNLKRIGNIRMPLLIIHGDRDTVINQSHGRKLFEAGNEPKQFYSVTGAGHNDIHSVAGDNYWNILNAFIEEKVLRKN